MTFEAHSNVPVKDLRNVRNLVSLKDHGFELLHRPSQLVHSLDEPEVLDQYLQETNDMLKKELNAEIVICYDVKVSR